MVRRIATSLLVATLLLAGLAALALRDNPARAAAGRRASVRVGDAEIEYFLGSGAGALPVALVASWGRSVSDLNELAAALGAAGHPTLALQLRGVDGSSLPSLRTSLFTYATDLEAALRHAGFGGRVAVVGHAYGNRVARAFASRFPERVAGLVLLAAGGDRPLPRALRSDMSRALFQVWPESVRSAAIGRAFFASSAEPPRHWLEGWYPLAGIAEGRATATTPLDTWEGGGTARILVLEPADDVLAGGAGERLQGRHPARVTVERVPDAGHALLPEQPERVSRAVLAFLATF